MPEYFVVSNSFAAPFVSDKQFRYATGSTPQEALESFTEHYTHRRGLYSADLYSSAKDYHQSKPPLLRYRNLRPVSVDKQFHKNGVVVPGPVAVVVPGHVNIDGNDRM